MNDSDKPTETQDIPDPKEAMREALERKKNASHASAAAGPQGEGKVGGGPHKAANAKRMFRRKSGG